MERILPPLSPCLAVPPRRAIPPFSPTPAAVAPGRRVGGWRCRPGRAPAGAALGANSQNERIVPAPPRRRLARAGRAVPSAPSAPLGTRPRWRGRLQVVKMTNGPAGAAAHGAAARQPLLPLVKMTNGPAGAAAHAANERQPVLPFSWQVASVRSASCYPDSGCGAAPTLPRSGLGKVAAPAPVGQDQAGAWWWSVAQPSCPPRPAESTKSLQPPPRAGR
jgi:hypothetical protein